MSARRIYVAGACTGIPDENRPAFARESARLRGLGYFVINPTEGPRLHSWAAYMRRGLGQLLTCDEIVLLKGWHLSPGALEERRVAALLDMPCHLAEEIN